MLKKTELTRSSPKVSRRDFMWRMYTQSQSQEHEDSWPTLGISGSEQLGSCERNLNKQWVGSEDLGDSGSHRGPLGGITIYHLPPEVALRSKTLATQHMSWCLDLEKCIIS